MHGTQNGMSVHLPPAFVPPEVKLNTRIESLEESLKKVRKENRVLEMQLSELKTQMEAICFDVFSKRANDPQRYIKGKFESGWSTDRLSVSLSTTLSSLEESRVCMEMHWGKEFKFAFKGAHMLQLKNVAWNQYLCNISLPPGLAAQLEWLTGCAFNDQLDSSDLQECEVYKRENEVTEFKGRLSGMAEKNNTIGKKSNCIVLFARINSTQGRPEWKPMQILF